MSAHQIAMASMKRILVFGICICTSCDHTSPHSTARVEHFEALMADTRSVSLSDTGGGALVDPVAALVVDRQIFVLDAGVAKMQAYDNETGAFRGSIDGPGDDFGDLRKPTAIAALDHGGFVVYDNGRRVLSIRDKTGRALREIAVPDGSYTGVLPRPGTDLLSLSGNVFYVQDSVKASAIHDIDRAGHRVSSYGMRRIERSPWRMAFGAVFASRAGDEVVFGTMVSNQLHFFNDRTGVTRDLLVAPGWYQDPEWPSDNVLLRNVTRQTAGQHVVAFAHQHRLMSGVYRLGGSRLLVRFQGFDFLGRRFFNYAVVESDGSTSTLTHPTRAQVVATLGDTIFWIEGRRGIGTRFGRGVFVNSEVNRLNHLSQAFAGEGEHP